MRVVDPARAAQAGGRDGRALAEARHVGQARADVVAQRRELRRRPVEAGDRAEVQLRRAALLGEERRVQRPTGGSRWSWAIAEA